MSNNNLKNMAIIRENTSKQLSFPLILGISPHFVFTAYLTVCCAVLAVVLLLVKIGMFEVLNPKTAGTVCKCIVVECINLLEEINSLIGARF